MRRPALTAGICFCAGILLRIGLGHLPLFILIGFACVLWMIGLCAVVFHLGQRWGICPMLLLATLGAVRYDLHTQALPAHHFVHFLRTNSQVVITGRVIEEPEILNEDWQCVVLVDRLTAGDTTWATTGRALIRFQKMALSLDYGNRVSMQLFLRFPDPARNPGAFDYQKFLNQKGIYGIGFVKEKSQILHIEDGQIDAWAQWVLPVRRYIRAVVDRHLSGGPAGLLKGILLGEKRAVPDTIRQDFARCGVNHVLSVSGLHVGLIAGVVFFFLRLIGMGRLTTAITTTGMVCFYAIVTGLPPSVVRASVMGGLALCGVAGQREVDGANTLGAAGLVLLIVRPRDVLDIGFQLSFVATGGIFLFYKPILHLITKKKKGFIHTWVGGPLALSIAAQIITTPLVVGYFGLVSVVGLLANLIVVPLVGIGATIGVITVLTDMVYGPLSMCLNGANWVVLKGAIWIAQALSAYEWAAITVVQPPFIFWGIYGLLAILLVPKVRRARAGRYALIGVLVLGNIWIWQGFLLRSKELTIYMLDVGQGDACFLVFPGGRTMLVDGGIRAQHIDMGERVIAPFLRHLGISRIDVVVGSHPHSDHIGGLISILETFEVGHYIDAGQPVDTWTGKRIHELVAEKHIRYHAVAAGDSLVGLGRGGALVLHPAPDYVSNTAKAPYGLNNGSVVLRVVFEGQVLLLTGDIEHETDSDLLRWKDRLQAQILKAAHHGSRTSSTPAFIKRVRPDIVTVSCGVGNKFRHPAPEVIQRYQSTGSQVYRTDYHGAISLRLGHRGIFVETCLDK